MDRPHPFDFAAEAFRDGTEGMTKMTRISKCVAVSLAPADYTRLLELAAGAATAPTTLAGAMLTAAIENTLDNPPLDLGAVRFELKKLQTEYAAAKETLAQLQRETGSIARWLGQSFSKRIHRREYVASAPAASATSNSVRVLRMN